jgi:hypothetical protein
MKTQFWRLGYGVLALSALLCVSCSSQKADVPKTYSASIKITQNGTPVEGATVTLVPKEATGRGASGLTNASGVAQMALPGLTEGVVPGDYWVGVSKVKGEAADASMTPEQFYQAQEERSGDPAASGPEHLLPKKYLAAQSSGLECVVTEQHGQTFEFDLTD